MSLSYRARRRPSAPSTGRSTDHARAADAILLLVDEPTARRDEENARTSGTLLARAAHRRGLAVVCATHDSILIELADELVRLGPQAQLLTEPQLPARLPAVS